MGLRSFVAKGLAKFLLNHGNLDDQVQFLVKQTTSCQEQVGNLDDQVQFLVEQTTSYQEQVGNLDDQVQFLIKQTTSCQEQVGNLDDQVQFLVERTTSCQEQKGNLDDQVQFLVKQTTSCQEQVGNLDDQVQFLIEQTTSYQEQEGNLDDQDQFLVEQTTSCQEQVVVPLISYLANNNNNNNTNDNSAPYNQFVEGLQFTTLHSIIVWMASMIIVIHLAKERVWRRKEIKLGSSSSATTVATYSSCGSSKWWSSSWYHCLLSNAVNGTLDVMPFLLAIASLSLATMQLILSSYVSDEKIIDLMMMVQYPQLNLNKVVWEKYLFALSLWSILISVLMVLASLGWKALDPRRVRETTSSSNSNKFRTVKKKKMTWRDDLAKVIANAQTTILVISIISIPILSYIHLPLFRHALRNEIDYLDLFHLPPRVSTALHQCAWSFLSYCTFVKLFPREVPIMTMANNTTTMPELGTRKVKKYVTDPAVVQRMSALAKEALERVQARKDGKKRMLRRTHSEGNFGNMTTSTALSSMVSSSSSSLSLSSSSSIAPLAFQRRGSSSRISTLASLPEHHGESKGGDSGNNVRQNGRQTPQMNRSSYSPQSPLTDIHMAGPTLSSSDLLAKLKNSSSMKRSMSVPVLADEAISF